MSANRQLYRSFGELEPTLALFHRPWWLDATCGPDGWDVVVVEQSGKVVAALPFQPIRNRGLSMVTQPPLTMFLGPWLAQGRGKLANDLSRQKDLMGALIDGLPRYDYFRQSFAPQIQNWLPFYWHGFQQTTRYTYVLDNLTDLDSIWNGFRDNIRSDIRKATQRYDVKVSAENDISSFLDLVDKTYARQGKHKTYSSDLVEEIAKACSLRNCHRIFVARGPEGKAHAGVMIVWDQHSAFYIVGGGDPELRNSGATSLCLWEAIKFSAGVTKQFDFEGSMMEPVERFFRAFGARQIPYFSVSHAAGWKARLALASKSLLSQ